MLPTELERIEKLEAAVKRIKKDIAEIRASSQKAYAMAFQTEHKLATLILEKNDNPLSEIRNKWPGDESIEEILDTLKKEKHGKGKSNHIKT